MYSFEDKCFIEQFVTRHSLDAFSAESEEKWQELGNIMNRNWEDIRKMYQNWKIQNNQSQSASELESSNGQSGDQNLHFVIETELLPEEGSSDTIGSDTMDFVNINGQLIRTHELQYVLEAPLHLQSIDSRIDSSAQSSSSGQPSSSVQPSSVKRPRDVLESESNSEIVKILEKQVIEELELKKQEHEEKIMVYKQMLIQGAELHKEKMKILRAKLRAIEEKVECIDSVICNRNLRKKFKSGPI